MLKYLIERLQGKIPKGAKRSNQWPVLRRTYLLYHPRCSVCGGKKRLEVHHIVPFHIDPALELEVSNLTTLCESRKGGVNCHLFFGHLGDFKRANPDVNQDARTWRAKL